MYTIFYTPNNWVRHIKSFLYHILRDHIYSVEELSTMFHLSKSPTSVQFTEVYLIKNSVYINILLVYYLESPRTSLRPILVESDIVLTHI